MTRTQDPPNVQPTRLETALAELQEIATSIAELRYSAAGLSALDRLAVIHESAGILATLRTSFADLKGMACLEANNEGASYPVIAAALGCSEPYVQQMIYRGRAAAAALEVPT